VRTSRPTIVKFTRKSYRPGRRVPFNNRKIITL
jgi:hypothetical protein